MTMMNIRRIIREELEWIEDSFYFTEDMVEQLLSNCEDLAFANYNLSIDSPYTRRGKPNIYYLSMCDYWWDLLADEPVDEHGRGIGEWFRNRTTSYSVAIIMPDMDDVSDLRNMDIDEFSAITDSLSSVAKYFNAERGDEFWFLVDKNKKPRYDLIPKKLHDRIRKNYEPLIG